MRSSARLPLLAILFALPSPAQPAAIPEGVPLRTRFAAEVSATRPRPEPPRPTLVRADGWLSLNGPWEFREGSEGPFGETILVPFAPETGLSGLYRNQKIMERVGYRRRFEVPEGWRKPGRVVLLHFEAVDWEATVRVDGKAAGTHRGGYGRFSFDITTLLGPDATHLLEVEVYDPADPAKAGKQPRGKQLGSEGIWYTRTTGIWQSVWLESAPAARIDSLRPGGDASGRLEIRVGLAGAGDNHRLEVRVSGPGKDGRTATATLEGAAPAGGTTLAGAVANVLPWSPEQPVLYDLEVRLLDAVGNVLDCVTSYAGFRTVSARDGVWTLNGRPYFLRGVLDQGYWPESGLTAPSDEALRADVELAKELGLNLARKHVKLEDARWYHWCDRLGLLVMQDMPSSMDLSTEEAKQGFLDGLGQMVEKAGPHPSVVHWVVFNEDWGKPGEWQDRAVDHLRKLDPGRPVTDASGWTQRSNTDVTDVHDYGADLLRHGQDTGTRTKIVGECGGVAFSLEGHRWSKGWGYTQAGNAEDYLRRVGRLAAQPPRARNLSGFVWTQLSDVEQELNGLVHYDRTPKVPAARLRRALLGLAGGDGTRIVPGTWQVLGPIPHPEAPEGTEDSPGNRALLAAALDLPHLPDEAAADPKAGQRVEIGTAEFHWLAAAPAGETLDLRRLLGDRAERCVAYAAATLELPRSGRFDLQFGSDDGARVWIDGREVHRVERIRGCRPADDEVPGLDLAAGRHRILVKVAQGRFGFGIALALVPSEAR